MEEFSIGSFAESLIQKDLSNPQKVNEVIANKAGKSLDKTVPDISKVEVPDSFISSITGRKPLVESTKKTIQRKLETREKKPERKGLSELIEELKSLLVEVKSTLDEMTTTGMIGTNLGGAKTKKKKVNPFAICHSTTGKKKTAKFERCVKKIKSKYGIE